MNTIFIRYFGLFTEGYGRIYCTGGMGSNDQILTANKVYKSQGSETLREEIIGFYVSSVSIYRVIYATRRYFKR